MENILITILFLFASLNLNAQIADTIINQEVAPKGGINQLAIKYYGIDFTKEQREELKGKEIEFIFQIDKNGKPTLSEINGINNVEIIDSLKTRTNEIDNFSPRIRNGIAEESIFFMLLEFPTYKMTQSRFGILQGMAYEEARLNDFEYINKSNERFDILIGGMVNQFFGKPSKHLAFGGGMKTDLMFSDKKQFLYGLQMNFYGNRLKKNYPLNTTRDQLPGPPTLLLGAIFGKWFNRFNIQSEINIAVQNVTERLEDDDPDWVQLRGWSPGIVINYPIELGKEKPMYYYGSPKLLSNNVNLHFGLRYISLSIDEASGVMAELGIAYRMVLYGVKEYKLK